MNTREVAIAGDRITDLVEVANRFTVVGLAAMGCTMIGVVLLLGDIAFPSTATVIITASAVVACSITWYAMPLTRGRDSRIRESE